MFVNFLTRTKFLSLDDMKPDWPDVVLFSKMRLGKMQVTTILPFSQTVLLTKEICTYVRGQREKE